MAYLWLIIGLIIGATAVYLVMNAKGKAAAQSLEHFQSRATALEQELSEAREELKETRRRSEELNLLLRSKEDELRQAEKDKSEQEKAALEQQAQMQTALSKARFMVEQKQQELEELRKKQQEQEEKFLEIERNFKEQFKNLAEQILEEKSRKFTEAGKKDLDEIVRPLREKIKDFEKEVRETYQRESNERFNLKEELKKLNEMNIRLSEDARSLTTALKGDSKTQGDWGEMILENILSSSGLTEGREYEKQSNIKDEEGSNFRPDFIVRYPDEHFIIIDSKVSLSAYERYVSEEDEEKRRSHLQAHLQSVRNHVKELGSKRYQDKLPQSPDFVMMFLPIEPAYMLALHSDPQLWNEAYDKRVLLMSPTNLIAALKMIHELWKHDSQNKNAQNIAERAGALYDKFVTFYQELDTISKNMERVSVSFDKAKKQLGTGRGNLLGRVESLKKMGIPHSKNLPEASYKALRESEDQNLENTDNE